MYIDIVRQRTYTDSQRQRTEHRRDTDTDNDNVDTGTDTHHRTYIVKTQKADTQHRKQRIKDM